MAYIECDQQNSGCPMGLVIGVQSGEEVEIDYTE